MHFSNIQHLWWLIPIVLVLGVGMFFSLVDRPKFWKWTSFALRIGAVVMLILALCRPFQKGDADDLHVVFMVDGSSSVSAEGLKQAADGVEKAVAKLDSQDSHSIVLCARSSKKVTVEELREFAKQVELDGGDADFRSASNISKALLSTRMQFGADKARKVVLFSDGVPTDTGTDLTLKTLEKEGITFSFQKLPSIQKTEASVVDFKSLVPTAYESEIVRFQGEISTNKEMDCFVRLLHRGVEVQKQPVKLKKNQPNRVGFDVEMYTSGNSRWTMEIQPEEDYFPMNNQVSTTIQVSGKPRVLAIHKDPKEMRPFARALRKQGIELDVRGAKGLPNKIEELMAFKAILLCDVPATDLTVPQMFDLKRYVSELGGGLGMLGSENSFGIGGYHSTPVDEILPVTSRYEKEKIKPSLAMVLVIDKSGSMSGVPIQLARQAAKAAVELLGSQDSIAVVGFDSNAQTIVEMTSAAHKGAIKDSIDSLMAGGGTNLQPSMVRAKEMLDTAPAKIKHMIILSDGQTAGGGYEELATELRDSRVTISTVALGDGAAKDLMQALAVIGKGRYYETNDPANVPQIFTKETMQASKSAIKEDLYGSMVTAEHPMLSGFEKAELPFIMGYVMTQARPTAKVVLTTELGDPLLATNRFGLGQTFAYTSDLTEKWGSEWLGWSACGKFWNQAIRAILRKEDGRGIQVKKDIRGEEMFLHITRKDDAGNFINNVQWNAKVVGENGKPETLAVEQTGIGGYAATISLKGKEKVQVVLRDTADGRNRTIYWQRPYPAEFQLSDTASTELDKYAGEDLEQVRQNIATGVVEKDRLPWFAFAGVTLAIMSIFARRI